MLAAFAGRSLAETRVLSLAASGGLGQLGLFDISFERDAAGGIKLVWIASANGLHSYDGYRWKRYGVKDGLPSDFVRCVLATRSGDLWVGTDQGAGVFKPPAFDTRGAERGLAGPNVRRIIEDRAGVIWFTSDSWPNAKVRGGIASRQGGQWRAWHTEDGLPSGYVVNQFTDSRGRSFAMTLKGPALLVGNRWVPERMQPLIPGTHWGSAVMTEAPALGVVLSNGDQVLVRSREESAWRELGKPPRHQHGLLVTVDGRLIIAGDTGPGRKAFFEWSGQAWSRASGEFAVPRSYGEELREAPDGSIWYLGFDCLVRWQRQSGEWKTLPQAAPGQIFPDGAGGVWSFRSRNLPTHARQLFQLVNGNWVSRGRLKNYAVDKRGAVWAIADRSVERWSKGAVERWGPAATGLVYAAGLAVDGSGTVWLAGRNASGAGALAYFDGAWHKRLTPLLGRPARFELAPSLQAGIWCLVYDTPNEASRLVFATASAAELLPLPDTPVSPFDTALQADPDGGLWLAGGTRPQRLSADRKWTAYGYLPARRVRSIGFQGRRTWLILDELLGGQGGLWLEDPGRQPHHQHFAGNLTTGFNQSPDTTLVGGGPGKVYAIPPGASVPLEIQLPDRTALHSAFRDSTGAFWIATAESLSIFRPDRVPPETDVISSGNAVLAGQPFIALANARERFLPPADSLGMTYSWRLDGGPWSEFASSSHYQVQPRLLGIGRHRLSARARDNGQDIDSTPAEAIFDVLPLPIQERPWFLPALVTALGLLALATVVALQARRKVARQATELETRVQERTASLREEMAQRDRVESELRASDQRSREIVEAAQEGIAVFDQESRCRLANREFARLVNQPLSRLLGQAAADFLDPAALTLVERILNQRIAAASPACDLRLSPAGSEPREVKVAGRPLLDSSGRTSGTLLTAIDLTVLHKAEVAIRKSEAYYRQLFEAHPNPMFVVDLNTFRILSANAAAVAGYGYSPAELRAMTLLDLQVEENLAAARELIKEPFPAPRNWSWKHRRKDGTVIDVEISSQDVEFLDGHTRLVMASDTTERNRALAALKESEANLARAQRLAQVGSFQYDAAAPDQRATWSAEVRRILGLAPEAALGPATLLALVHPEDRARWCDAEAKARNTGRPVEFEHRLVRPDGSLRQLRTTLAVTSPAMPGTAGGALTGTLQDITEHRQLEDQLRQSQKLESIGRLAGGVAHDFNNLLTVINGYSGRILKRLDPQDSLHAEAAQVVEAGRQAASLTRQLLSFGRKQTLRLQAVNLNEAIAGSLTLLSPLIGEGVELTTEFAPGPLLVMVDPSHFQQVLLNLAVNARDAMPRGGRLTMRTLSRQSDPPLAAIEVVDTGIGMTAEVRRHIFEPFFTTKDRTGGTGLGLSTVYGIVQQSGGSIEVESEPGQGALFRVLFPRLDAPSALAPPAAAPAEPRALVAGGQEKALLLVEDQPEVREFAAAVLRSAGYHVLQAAHGVEALALSQAQLRSVDLLVTDMIMPGMTGLELAAALRQRRSPDDSLRVLYISGFTADAIASEEAGRVPVLEKPFAADDLLRSVADILGAASPAR